MGFLEQYWEDKISKGLAKNGKIDIQVDVEWKIKLAERHGVKIPDDIQFTGDKGRYLKPITVFTVYA